jgi:hypothetical protein
MPQLPQTTTKWSLVYWTSPYQHCAADTRQRREYPRIAELGSRGCGGVLGTETELGCYQVWLQIPTHFHFESLFYFCYFSFSFIFLHYDPASSHEIIQVNPQDCGADTALDIPNQLPRTKIYALHGIANHPDDPFELSTFSNYQFIWPATQGKPGGAGPNDVPPPPGPSAPEE